MEASVPPSPTSLTLLKVSAQVYTWIIVSSKNLNSPMLSLMGIIVLESRTESA